MRSLIYETEKYVNDIHSLVRQVYVDERITHIFSTDYNHIHAVVNRNDLDSRILEVVVKSIVRTAITTANTCNTNTFFDLLSKGVPLSSLLHMSPTDIDTVFDNISYDPDVKNSIYDKVCSIVYRFADTLWFRAREIYSVLHGLMGILQTQLTPYVPSHNSYRLELYGRNLNPLIIYRDPDLDLSY